MLIHEQMMDELRGWAKDKGVPLVDIIALLDDRRDLLLSWVHLHPEANARIAEALAKPILKLFCSETAGI